MWILYNIVEIQIINNVIESIILNGKINKTTL